MFSAPLTFWTVSRRLVAALVSAVAIYGCAAAIAPLHELHYCNVGAVPLTSIRIQYGELVWPRTAERKYGGGDTRCLGGAGITAKMPVPDYMKIDWTTADGVRHSANVTVKAKLNGRFSTSAIQVRFNSDSVEVYERAYATSSDRREFRVFP